MYRKACAPEIRINIFFCHKNIETTRTFVSTAVAKEIVLFVVLFVRLIQQHGCLHM